MLAVSAGKERIASSTHPLDIDQRSGLIVDELSSELGSLIRVETCDVLEQRGVVGSVVHSLGVHDDFGKLASLGEAGTAACQTT